MSNFGCEVIIFEAYEPRVQHGVVEGFVARALLFNAFPDWHETIEDIITEGDKVCVLLNATATHTGEWNFLGVTLAPTGKKIAYTAVNIWRVVDGKIVERKSVRDLLVFLTQLGLIQPTEKGKKLFPESAT